MKSFNSLTWYWRKWHGEFGRDYSYWNRSSVVVCSPERYPAEGPPRDCPAGSRPSTTWAAGSYVRATWPADCISGPTVPIGWAHRRHRRREAAARCSPDSVSSGAADRRKCRAEFSRCRSRWSPAIVGRARPNPARLSPAKRRCGSSACEGARCPLANRAPPPACDSNQRPAHRGSLGGGKWQDEGRIRRCPIHWRALMLECWERTRARWDWSRYRWDPAAWDSASWWTDAALCGGSSSPRDPAPETTAAITLREKSAWH